ncbi:UNVERIFIED_CONTAM: hypothetical protein PYX00_001425 [Menopon gallinae]|uniref:Uncharacterized protein n=1 Tax=Menopon gallinae TaxID=328185 RepID=A0AAW2IE32_9NEOP
MKRSTAEFTTGSLADGVETSSEEETFVCEKQESRKSSWTNRCTSGTETVPDSRLLLFVRYSIESPCIFLQGMQTEKCLYQESRCKYMVTCRKEIGKRTRWWNSLVPEMKVRTDEESSIDEFTTGSFADGVESGSEVRFLQRKGSYFLTKWFKLVVEADSLLHGTVARSGPIVNELKYSR